MKRMKILQFLGYLVVHVALFVTVPTTVWSMDTAPLHIENDAASAQLTISFNHRPVLVYAYSARQYKPYIKALFDLSGYNVLLDAPADHLHHHGIMYAVMVNGVNYWQERQETGTERSIRIEGQQVGINERGLPYASFIDVIEWLDPAGRGTPEGEQPFLQERRTISVTVDEPNKEVAVQWSADFAVGTHTKSIVLTGDPYNGLGLRLSKDFDSRVTHRNSEKTLDSREGDPNISKARWTAASINLAAQASMVAVFGDLGNHLGDPVYFLMYKPFAYISATQALDKNKLEYPAGARYRLNFLVTVYPQVKGSEFLQKRAQDWERAGFQTVGTGAN